MTSIELENVKTIDYKTNEFQNLSQLPDDNEYWNLNCVGFQTLVARGAEWAATGKVNIPIPKEFPSEVKSLSTDTKLVNWKK